MRGRARDAEVGDVHLAVVVEQQVAGLDVSMDDAGCVCGVERDGGLVEPGNGRVLWNRTVAEADPPAIRRRGTP